MKRFLWNRTFWEWLEEEQISEDQEWTEQEQACLQQIYQLFERKAQVTRQLYRQMEVKQLMEDPHFSELVQSDVYLQICLVYALALYEHNFICGEIESRIEADLQLYARELPMLECRYRFERSGFLQQLKQRES
ncbi:hypothetical protein RU97_GL002105 [Enterococcus canis]|uniref:Uncharacterized protein n=1 Tax=Enterococcus canis TaxID=214095 RepID=A0A1L8REB5_9ENTE|nr:hypothetical protein [Enterococcus canis]OJG18032.1 hypothetical protein RU97_GL002105 [Enterococcus canis]